jgi:hypothetical protein
MNKTRYRLTLAIMALAAPPLALVAFMLTAYFIRVIEYPEFLSLDKFTDFLRPSEIINWLPACYVFGLFPTLYVVLAINKSVRLKRKLRIKKIYLVSLVLAVLPWLALTLGTGRIQGFSLVFASAISASVAFFILLPIGKKLLAWSGISLNEISAKETAP